jgi:predicted transcriptional regulator
MIPITIHKNAIWVILPRYDIKTNIKINYGMQYLRLWNRYPEMRRRGTRRVPMFIIKNRNKRIDPEGVVPDVHHSIA